MKNTKLKLPKSWSDVTVNQYIALSNVTSTDEYSSFLDIITIFTNNTKETLLNMDIDDINKISESMLWLQEPVSTEVITEYKLNGKKYGIPKLDKLSLGQMITLEMLIDKHKPGYYESIPYILAVVVRDVDNKGEYLPFNANEVYNNIELFGNLSINETNGLLFFLTSGGTTYTQIIEASSVVIEEMIQKEMKKIKAKRLKK